VLEVDSIDRMYLNGYVPLLQTEGSFVCFVRDRLGYPIASTAVIAPMTERFVQSIERFAQQSHIDVAAFEKGSARTTWRSTPLPKGCCLSGKAREKARVFRTTRSLLIFPLCR
jgi:hypothetical protein